MLFVETTGALLPIERALSVLKQVYLEEGDRLDETIDFTALGYRPFHESTTITIKTLSVNGERLKLGEVEMAPVGCCAVGIQEQIDLGIEKVIQGRAWKISDVGRVDAKNWAALAACRKLREIGVLDDHLRVASREEKLRQIKANLHELRVPRWPLTPQLEHLRPVHDALDTLLSAVERGVASETCAFDVFAHALLRLVRVRPQKDGVSIRGLLEKRSSIGGFQKESLSEIIVRLRSAVEAALPEQALGAEQRALLTQLERPEGVTFQRLALLGGEAMLARVCFPRFS